MLTFVSFVLVFGGLVFIHELGHFTIAKLSGVRVHEFAMGMGPKLISVTRGETAYSLRLLPIGGFVRMAGEEPGDEDDPRGFDKRPIGARMAILAAGPLSNFALAILLFIMVFMLMGVPSESTLIGEVLPGQPAEKAGITAGDRVLAIDGQIVSQWSEVVTLINAAPNRNLVFSLQRGSETKTIAVTPQLDAEGKRGVIGIAGALEKFDLLQSIKLGFQQTITVTQMMVGGLWQAIVQRSAPDVAGPVGIISLVGEVARVGLVNLLWLAAFLSINLGFLNLLPFPALDGGRLLFTFIELVRGRPVDPKKEGFIHFVGFVILLLLIGVVTYKDIMRLISGAKLP